MVPSPGWEWKRKQRWAGLHAGSAGPTSRLALVGVKIGAGVVPLFLLWKHFLKSPLNHKPGLKIDLAKAPDAGEHGSFMSAQS